MMQRSFRGGCGFVETDLITESGDNLGKERCTGKDLIQRTDLAGLVCTINARQEALVVFISRKENLDTLEITR